jgi:hypothetical protein
MKELCPVCQQYKLKRKGAHIQKCTKCAYEYTGIDFYDKTVPGFLSVLEYEILPNGHKTRVATKLLCKGTFEYCIMVFKLKAFI